MQTNQYHLSYLSSVISNAPLRLKALIIVLLTGFGFLFTPLIAHADYSAPSWWNGDQCDSTHYTAGNGHTPVLQTTWLGVQSCGYGPYQNPYNWSDVSVTLPGASAADYEWECTELVKRYLYIAYGATALSSTNGDQVVANYASRYPSKFKSISNTTDSWHGFPNVGDVISYSDVHTAIITGVTVTDQANGNATLTLAEQNASLSGTTTQKVIGWKIKGDIDDPNDTRSDTVTAWLTPLQWSNNSPSVTTNDSIRAMAASSTTNAWAAGYENGSHAQPVTYLNSGSGWTKYSPTPQGSSDNYLYGIATNSTSNAWAVGSYMSPYIQTLAYHWTGSSWGTAVTSANPGGSTCTNQLNAVALDSSSTPWAAGYYWCNGSNSEPMIQKWNGSQFVNQTITLPSGGGQLNGISFSTSYGWAVGYSTGTGASYLIYKYSGSSWSSPTIGSISGAVLKSVAAVSDTEAWAVGYQPNGSFTKPLILHTTDGGSTWVEDTSFNGSYPSGYTYLNSVSADSSSDVWIVGYDETATANIPFTMHNNGSGWKQVTTPSSNDLLRLWGVAVNSGDAWAGGQDASNGHPLTFKSL